MRQHHSDVCFRAHHVRLSCFFNILKVSVLLLTGWSQSFAQTPSRRVPLNDPSVHRVQFEVGAHDTRSSGSDRPGDSSQVVSATSILAGSSGCLSCHAGQHDPHNKPTVRLSCTDCHGGNAQTTDKIAAHVHPRFPQEWPGSANPHRSYTLLNRESPEFIRFVNPGDLRVAKVSCGTSGCHDEIVDQVGKSMMTHGAMLWNAALYNNGAVPHKIPRFGESYTTNGVPQRLITVPQPTAEEIALKGVLPYLDPLPRFEVSQPGNLLRIFERGKLDPQEVGLPNPKEEPGRPRAGLSARGLGTKTRTDPVFLGLQKTRLLDPTLNFLGTNDHPGDYRSSGCTSCHVVYANDRSPVNSGPFAIYGNRGTSAGRDPTIPRGQSGHPIEHKFTVGIPTSQCIVCHVHPGTTVMNSYTGFMWWDEETDAEFMFPEIEKNPTAAEYAQSQMRNPDEAAARGLWSDPEFLANLTDLNPSLKHTQFADYHGHGWVYKAVFKKDRQGNLIDHRGKTIDHAEGPELQQATGFAEEVKKLYRAVLTESEFAQAEDQLHQLRDGQPVHQMDIHLEKGMHCVDCHFIQDAHGNAKLYGEVRNAIEIQCTDCHGQVGQRATLLSSGPASDTSAKQSGKSGRDLAAMRTPFGERRFERQGEKIIQRSMVEKDLKWEITQVADSINPASASYNQRSHLAKTVRFEGNQMVWGDQPGSDVLCAHSNRNMSCISCHSSWNPSCFGCHLPQKANRKTPMLHNEGEESRNAISYNFQTLRDDVFMLARDGDVTGNRIGPARSSCAIHVGSYNANRESLYVQQQTVSAEGMSGIAFSTNVPHTVRGSAPTFRDGPEKGLPDSPEMHLAGRSETKMCTDCHLSENSDNNAIMAQLLMQGTNFTNFIGRYCWVASGEHGLSGVVVTEQDEPQTVIGSSLHRIVYPQRHEEHLAKGQELEHLHEHPGRDVSELFRKPEVLALQARGEYLYAACGSGGLKVFDIAFIDHKGFSERITTAPVSPFGQKLYVKTADARDVTAPTTIAPDPTRAHWPENREQNVHMAYAYIYVADAEEGLVMVSAATLLDGNPLNNFLKKDLVFNPDGILRGAKSVTLIGTYVYVGCDAGLVVVSVDDPGNPQITTILKPPVVHDVRDVEAQFRYAFVADSEGIKVLDVTDPAHPVPVTAIAMAEAHKVYPARTYAYVAGGHEGLVILNIENPEKPFVDQVFNADGQINDLRDVKLGITYTSLFAYLADGHNGLRVVQLTSTETPGYQGFSPRPTPVLVASAKLPKSGEALAIAEGIDRDRAVDESGNQIAVFGRVGARPLSITDQQRMYLHNNQLWFTSDNPASPVYRRLGGGSVERPANLPDPRPSLRTPQPLPIPAGNPPDGRPVAPRLIPVPSSSLPPG